MSELLTRLDNARMTPLHRRLAWSAGLGIFLDGYDLSIIAEVQKRLAKPGSLPPMNLVLLRRHRWPGHFLDL